MRWPVLERRRWLSLVSRLEAVNRGVPLACQVDLAMTPDRSWSVAMQSGRAIRIGDEGQGYVLGPILDPTVLIAALSAP